MYRKILSSYERIVPGHDQIRDAEKVRIREGAERHEKYKPCCSILACILIALIIQFITYTKEH